MARAGPLAVRISSRIRSKTSTLASTAMPMVSTIPAMPGSVSVAPTRLSSPKISPTLRTSAILAKSPKSP